MLRRALWFPDQLLSVGMSQSFADSLVALPSRPRDEVPVLLREETVEVPRKVLREKTMELPPLVVEKEVEVEEVVVTERVVEVPKIVERTKVVHKPRKVVKEYTVEVPQFEEVPVEVERTVVVPQIQEEVVPRIVKKPVYQEHLVECVVPVPVPTPILRNGLQIYETIHHHDYEVPEIDFVYEDIDVEIRVPRFVEVPPAIFRQRRS